MKVVVWFAAVLFALATADAQAGLIHHLTFDDADIVNTKDAGDVVGGVNAVPTGTAGGSNITTGNAGVAGQAYGFTKDTMPVGGGLVALSDFENLLTIPAGNVPSGSSDRTIALWFNQTGTGGQQKLFGYGDNVADTAFDVSLEAGGVRLRTFGGNITYGGGSFDFTGADAGWHHVAVRHDGSGTFAGVTVFVDGVQQAQTGAAGGAPTDSINTFDSVFGIGTTSIDEGGAIQNGFDGLMDDFRIYDMAISDADIRALAGIPEPSTLLLGVAASCLMGVTRRRNG